MYSCNVPVPTEVARLARGLASDCFEATPRDRHTLVVKRLGEGEPQTLTRRVKRALEGTAPFEAKTAGVGVFETPVTGRGPVAYLRIDSPALLRIHDALCSVFDPIEELEGDEYVPHVTIARGGDAGRLAGTEPEPIVWTVESLSIWSGRYDENVTRISLPL